MFCVKCGQEIKEGTKFCTKCGTPVLQPAGTVKEPKAKKKSNGLVIALVLIVAVLVVCVGVGFYVWMLSGRFSDTESGRFSDTESGSFSDKSEEVEVIEKNNDEEQEDISETEVEATVENDTSEDVKPMTAEEFASTLPMCDLNGATYNYRSVNEGYPEPYMYTDGLKGYEGCIYYTEADLDSDGTSELLTFWIKQNPEAGNDFTAVVYENDGTQFESVTRTTLLEKALGPVDDWVDMRVFLKDEKYICFESHRLAGVSADGRAADLVIVSYDGVNLTTYDRAYFCGSDLVGIEDANAENAQKYDNIGMKKSADSIRKRGWLTFSMADSGIRSLFKLRIDNNYDYSYHKVNNITPTATCFFIKASENDYIFPQSATQYLTQQDLAGMDAAQLRIARNEIYARYGWQFEDEQLQNYFGGKSWYLPNYGYIAVEDSQLSEIEIANRDLIRKAEESFNVN